MGMDPSALAGVLGGGTDPGAGGPPLPPAQASSDTPGKRIKHKHARGKKRHKKGRGKK